MTPEQLEVLATFGGSVSVVLLGLYVIYKLYPGERWKNDD